MLPHSFPTWTWNLLLPLLTNWTLSLLEPFGCHTLRSLDQHLLQVLDVCSTMGRRSFIFAAQTIWNSPPLILHSSLNPIFVPPLRLIISLFSLNPLPNLYWFDYRSSVLPQLPRPELEKVADWSLHSGGDSTFIY